MKKNLAGLATLAFILIGTQALGDSIPNDELLLGRRSSSADKKLTLDINQGANNPDFRSNPATQDLQLRSNLVRVGKPTAGDKVLDFNVGSGATNPKLKWNNSSAKIEFSNNGTDFKSIGSGGGGGTGINLLSDSNPDFEAGAASWTASGGSFTIATSGTNLLFDTRSGVFNSSATSQTLSSALVSIPNGLAGASGVGYCYFKGSSSDYKIQVTDGTNVLSEQVIPALTVASKIAAPFLFPSSGSVRLRVISQSDAGDLALDNCFLGNDTLVQVSQANLYGAITISAGCAGNFQTTSTSFASFDANAGCTYTTEGNALAPTTSIYGIRFNSLPAGEYVIETGGSFYQGVAGFVASFRVSDGASFSREVLETYASTSTVNVPTLSFSKSYPTAQGSTTFELQAKTGATGAAAAVAVGAVIRVYRFPTQSEIAVKPEVLNWDADLKFNGANPSLGVATNAHQEVTDAALTGTNHGSLAAQVPCSGTNPSTGLTCGAGNPGYGIVVTAPRAGRVEVCADFSHVWQPTGVSGALYSSFKIVKTTNSTQTVEAESQNIQTDGHSGSVNIQQLTPVHVCGQFNLMSAGQHTFRLFYQQVASGAAFTASSLALDSNPGSAPSNARFTVRPIDQQTPAPVLVGSVTSSSSGVEVMNRITFNGGSNAACSSSPCNISSQSGGWVTSVTRTGTGTYQLNLLTGSFSSTPTCTCTTGLLSAASTCGVNYNTASTNTSIATIQTFDASLGTALDEGVQVLCQGPK